MNIFETGQVKKYKICKNVGMYDAESDILSQILKIFDQSHI